jgi:hypothetical protein
MDSCSGSIGQPMIVVCLVRRASLCLPLYWLSRYYKYKLRPRSSFVWIKL